MTISFVIKNALGQLISLGDVVAYPRQHYSGAISLVKGKVVKVVCKAGYRNEVKSYVVLDLESGFKKVVIKRTENLVKVL